MSASAYGLTEPQIRNAFGALDLSAGSTQSDALYGAAWVLAVSVWTLCRAMFVLGVKVA